MLSEGGTVPLTTRSCHGKRECRAERGSGAKWSKLSETPPASDDVEFVAKMIASRER